MTPMLSFQEKRRDKGVVWSVLFLDEEILA